MVKNRIPKSILPLSTVNQLPDISKEYQYVNYSLLFLIVLFLLYPLGVSLPDLPHGFLPFNLPTLNSALQNYPDLPCSSCGLTRSIVALYHGKLIASLGYNPVGIIIFFLSFLELGFRIIVMTVKSRWIAWLDLSQFFLCGLGVRIILELNL